MVTCSISAHNNAMAKLFAEIRINTQCDSDVRQRRNTYERYLPCKHISTL